MNYHYLIDFENVHKEGLAGLDEIEEGSFLHIFYSENARNITLSSFGNAKMLHMEVIKVPVGKQSLDMQLVSFLGYLIGKEDSKDNKYIIVSKDNGFGNTPLFWDSLGIGDRIEVRHQVGVEMPSEPQPELFPNNRVSSQPSQTAKSANNKNQKRNNRSQRKKLPAENVNANNTASQELQDNTPVIEKEEPKADATETEKQNTVTPVTSDFVETAEEKVEVPTDLSVVLADKTTESLPKQKSDIKAYEVIKPVIKKPVPDEIKKDLTVADAADIAEQSDNIPTVEAIPSESENNTEEKSETAATSEVLPAEPQQETSEDTDSMSEPIIEVAPVIQEEAKKETKSAKKPNEKATKKKGTQKKPQQPSEKTILNNQLMQTLAKGGVDAATSGMITSLILKNINEKNHKQLIYREIVKAHGQKNGLKFYALIKSMI